MMTALIAWLTAAAWAGLLTRESWVDSFTMRCTLLVDRSASLSWIGIHPSEFPSSAVRTTRGFSPRVLSWPAWLAERFAMANSSRKEDISLAVAALARASLRDWGGRSVKPDWR